MGQWLQSQSAADIRQLARARCAGAESFFISANRQRYTGCNHILVCDIRLADTRFEFYRSGMESAQIRISKPSLTIDRRRSKNIRNLPLRHRLFQCTQHEELRVGAAEHLHRLVIAPDEHQQHSPAVQSL